MRKHQIIRLVLLLLHASGRLGLNAERIATLLRVDGVTDATTYFVTDMCDTLVQSRHLMRGPGPFVGDAPLYFLTSEGRAWMQSQGLADFDAEQDISPR